MIERDLKAHGLVRLQDFGHLITNIKQDVQSELNEMVKRGEVSPIKIKGIDDTLFYANTITLQTFLNQRKARKSLYILSPFDNLLIQRKRMKELFDFDYTLECYVPAAKRKIGYFSLPILWGEQFVGQVDLKADRKTKILWIRNLVLENNIKGKEALAIALTKALKQFTEFNGVEAIQIAKGFKVPLPISF